MNTLLCYSGDSNYLMTSKEALRASKKQFQVLNQSWFLGLFRVLEVRFHLDRGSSFIYVIPSEDAMIELFLDNIIDEESHELSD